MADDSGVTYCPHNRMPDSCEHCLAQAAGLEDAFDGPAKALREAVVPVVDPDRNPDLPVYAGSGDAALEDGGNASAKATAKKK